MRPGSTDGRTFGAVQKTELDTGFVGQPAHQSIERIDLADEMTLAKPADCGVAGHLAQSIKPMGDQSHAGSDPCRGCGSFATGMAPADHDDVETAATLHAGYLNPPSVKVEGAAAYVPRGTSFPNAEGSENTVEHGFRIDAPDDALQLTKGEPDILTDELGSKAEIL